MGSASVEEKDGDIVLIAMNACRYGDIATIIPLLEESSTQNSLDVNQKDPDDITLLHWASINNRLEVVRYLLNNGADYMIWGGVLKEIPLQWAARQGHLHVVLELLSAGSDPNYKNIYGQNSLHLACQLGHYPVAALLLSYGIPVNDQDVKGMTPLMYGIKYQGKNKDLCRILMSFGAADGINLVDYEEHNSVLHWAVLGNNGPYMITSLIEAGVDLHAENKLGLTAEGLAISQRMYTAAAFLKNEKSKPRNSGRAYLMNGLLLFPVQISAVLIFVSYFGWVGLMPTLLVLLALLPIVRNIVRNPRNHFPLGVAIFSAIVIWLSFVLDVLPKSSLLESFSFNSFTAAMFFFLKQTGGSDPGFNVPSPEERNSIIRRKAAEEGAEGFGDDRFCSSCAVPTEPRSKHCYICKKCVKHFDHHCPFVANCVGQRNRRSFFLFIVASIAGISQYVYSSTQNVCLENSSGDGIFSTILGCFEYSRFLGCVVCLAIYHNAWIGLIFLTHAFMIMFDKTTYDCIKHREWVHSDERSRRCCRRFRLNCFKNCFYFWSGRSSSEKGYTLVSKWKKTDRCCEEGHR